MKIQINVNTNEVIDVMGVAWLKDLRENQECNIDMAMMEEDIRDSEELIRAINVILTHLGACDD